jgi:GxxExxY protein
MIEEELTGGLIKVFYKVYNALGYGFIESVYHNAMILELVESGFVVETEKPIADYYKDNIVGTFFADLVVDGKVLIELKAKETLHPAHEAQLVNYLRATEIEIGLLFNFGKRPEFKRKYFSNGNKRPSLDGGTDENILKGLFLENLFDPLDPANPR